MALNATVFNVMIASPGDVTTERDIAREVIHEWNAVNALTRRIVLLPIGWDTHCTPLMGDRPQAVINNQLLPHSDVLIAIFWTRLGTPTGMFDSGTVEEIEQHLKKDKPVSLYFSSAPINGQFKDEEQYARLLLFKKDCKRKGLLEDYSNPEEFRNKLRRQLSIAANKLNPLCGLPFVEASTRHTPSLSKEAKELLIEAALDARGYIFRKPGRGRPTLETNGKSFQALDARSRARWEGALQELQVQGFIQPFANDDRALKVTIKGFAIADVLRAETP